MKKRGGVTEWHGTARCRVHLDHQRHKATVASAKVCFKGAKAGVDPAVAALSELMREHAGYLPDVAKRAGLQKTTMMKWCRRGADPKLSYLRAALNAMGHDLVVVRRRP
jgi:DNA-binding phage protein